ncbi:hypothetical protein Pmani_016635 [Petrolisthes manimaculis]|uniref:Uncharacterized protein n=1 Tax=Petrolisthes manimaculis TaxID=1843537 RepID=A0AAE1PRU3_9EUCA|nr:hypothetical protein Pmani_016635 [Petrolisthes manimaculis]
MGLWGGGRGWSGYEMVELRGEGVRSGFGMAVMEFGVLGVDMELKVRGSGVDLWWWWSFGVGVGSGYGV